MPKPRMMYVEQKTGTGAGRAWIGRVSFSKSGRTLYYRDMAFTHGGGQSIYGNYYGHEKEKFIEATNAKIEDNKRSGYVGEFWISGPKKNGQDSHYERTDPVIIDEDVADEYRQLRGT